MADLEFAARHQFLAEALLEPFQAGRIARVALAAGGEYVGDFLVAVDVEEQVDAMALHLLLDEPDFRAALGARLQPGPVEILAGGVGAQVAVERAVRVHVRHQVQVGLFQQALHFRIVRPLQALDQAFHCLLYTSPGTQHGALVVDGGFLLLCLA